MKIQPIDFHRTAQKFVDASQQVYQAIPTLMRVLDGFRGPAGVDEYARQFDAQYHPAASAVIDGLNRAVQVLGDIGIGIDQAAANHWNADAAAVPGGAPSGPPWSPVDTGVVLPQRVEAPSLVGSPTVILPPDLQEIVPAGHIEDLRTVSGAFQNARDTIDNISVDLHNALEFLFSNNQSQDLDALNDFWNRIGGPADTAILTALTTSCADIARAVLDYADWINDTQNQIIDAIGNFIKDAALGAIPGIIIGMFEDGVGEIPSVVKLVQTIGRTRELVVVVRGVMTASATTARLAAATATAGGVIGAMSVAINKTPDPNLGSTSPQAATDAEVQDSAARLGDRAGTSADVGAGREVKVAELTDGTIPSGAPGTPGKLLIRPGVGKTDVDVIGKDGSFIAVGGPAKALDLAKLGQKLSILKWGAEQEGVGAQAFFEEGTPENVLNLARRKLGAENVHIFTR